MDYIKARTYIDESHRFGGEMGLEAITCLLEKLGNPHEALQFIHRLPDRQIYLPHTV